MSVTVSAPAAIRRVQHLQYLTVAWMIIEAGVSLTCAWKARSPALLAFGGDSTIELLSAATVLWRFRAPMEAVAEKRAARIAGVLLWVLAAQVAAISLLTLFGHGEPEPSYLGMGILIAALMVMPWLAREKRNLSATTGSAALRADAAQSALCAYLSLVALVGLALNALWHIRWADPLAAMVTVPFIVWEGREVLRGKACGCC